MHKLSLAVQYATNAENLPARHQFRRWIKAALQQSAQITLRVVDEIEGRELNRDYRGKDYATNVLTFVYDDTEPTPQPPLSGGLTGSSLSPPPTAGGSLRSCGEPTGVPLAGARGLGRPGGVVVSPLYGDIVICAPVVEKEAREQHKDLMAHYAHLAIHAVLHLQGYSHDNDTDAAAMETRETAIMLKLRYADPYQVANL